MKRRTIETRTRYHTLDGMRGVAALLVVAYHLQQRWHDGSIAGYLAVDLFFCISGFVIAMNYTGKFEHHLGVLRFIEIRLVRLFPLYALGFLLGIAKIAMGHLLHMPIAGSVGDPFCAAVFGVVMLPDPCSAEMFPLNGPSWSLFFEMIINIAFALGLWKCSAKVLAVFMAFSALSFPFLIGHPDFFNLGWAWHNIGGGAARTIYSFCAGVILYKVFAPIIRTTSYAALAPIGLMAAIIGVASPENIRSILEIMFVVLVFPGLVLLGCRFEVPSKILQKTFGFLGDLSYPIYALHWPLIAIIVPISAKLHLSASLSVVAFLIGIVPIAYVAAEADKAVRRHVSSALRIRRSAMPQIV